MIEAGRDLYDFGVLSVRGGNLSVRLGDVMLVTRTGASLAHLRPDDLVQVPVGAPDIADADASSDLAVHRAIYRLTGARAVAHAHPSSVIALSLSSAEVVPVDFEGKLFIPRVPVVEEDAERSVLGERAASALSAGPVVVVARSHGTYAVGDDIGAAANWTTCAEQSARVLLARR